MQTRTLRRNKKLIAARAALLSPSGSGLPMSRQEVADACNTIIADLCRQRGIHSRWAGVTVRTIGALERGAQTWTNDLYREALRTLFDRTDAELGLYVNRDQPSLHEAPPPVATQRGVCAELTGGATRRHEPASRAELGLPVQTRPFGTPEPFTRAIGEGPGDLEWSSFATMTQLLASQRQMIAPDALLGLVEAHRESLAALFHNASTDRLRGQIGAMLAEASIVASRLWSARGNRSLAIAHCAHARQLADRLDNPAAAAVARIFEANLHSNAANTIGDDGDLPLGLRLLQEAATVAHLLSPAALARIWAEQAQAYAALQLPGECDHALDQARAAVEQITDFDRTGLFSDWSASRLHVYEGTCLLLLGRAPQAVEVLTPAVQELRADPSNINVALAAQVDLATAHVASGDLEHGCHALGQAYLRIVDTGNRRGLDRAQRARQQLVRWNDHQHVRDLDATMAAR